MKMRVEPPWAATRPSPARLVLAIVMAITIATALASPALADPAAAPGSAASARPYGTCRQVAVPVALTPSTTRDQHIAGILCTPTAWSASRQIDLLIHGATYNHTYWDWPIRRPTYSYVDRTLAAGRATFAVDRLGAGASSRPLSTAATLGADAYTMHQVIGWLRGTEHYRTVNTVGHSVGSVVAITEAGTYRDVNRLIVTGLLHLPAPAKGIARLGPRSSPAALDPQFSASRPDPGWLTTDPGTRGTLFHASNDAADVVAYDESHKDVMSGVELAEVITEIAQPPAANPSSRITAPVLIAVGANDGVLCCTSSAAATEAPYYPAAASLTTRTIPGAGHDLTLSPTAPTSFNLINRWITDTPAS